MAQSPQAWPSDLTQRMLKSGSESSKWYLDRFLLPPPFPPPLVQSVFRRGKGFVSMFHLHQGYLHEEASWILGWENQRMYMYIKIRPKIKFWILDWEIKECICSAVPLNCLFKCSRRCLKIDDSWINLLLTEFILLSSVF